MTLYFQEVLGYGPLAAGLLFLPMALASVAAAAVAGRLTTRLGTGKTAALGLGGVVAGLLLVMGVSREGGLLAVLAGTVVGEAGFMFSNVSLTIAGTGATGEDGRGLAAGLLKTSVQLGNAWGLGVVATLVAATAGPGAPAGGLGAGLLACTGFVLLAMPIAFFGRPETDFFRPSTMERSKRSAGGGTACGRASRIPGRSIVPPGRSYPSVLPYPPPPGVSTVTTSPSCSSRLVFGGSSSLLRRFRPTRPGSPPSTPRGAWRRRSVRRERLAGWRTRTERTIPSPPRCSPSPPEP